MQARLTGNKLTLEFAYDAVVVAVVQTLEGRKFDKKTKTWAVPMVHCRTAYDRLKPLGFEFCDKSLKLVKEQVAFASKMLRLKNGEFSKLERSLIDALKLPLLKYQEVGSAFLCGVGSGLIGDQPGLGKTLQSLSATRLREAKKVLVFCPMSMKKTWQEEIEKWLPSQTSIVVGGSVEQRKKCWSKNVNFYICNYHLLLRDLPDMKKHDWDFILADEATAISNHRAKTTTQLKRLKSKRRIALTGTPLNNTVQDIWSIMDWVQPGLLGTYWQFVDEYCVKDKYGSISGFKNLGKLKQKLHDYMLRRLKSDVLHELPPKTFENIYVELSSEERRTYDVIREGTAEELKTIDMYDKKFLSKALVKMTRLKQLTCSMELINGQNVSAKTDVLKDLLAHILVDDEKTIIFTQFKQMALLLMRELEQYSPLLIAGGMSQEERDANRHAFNTDNVHKILVMTAAGDKGLNLQRASSVIHFDLPWSISSLEQREDRAHRHGQKRHVTIYKLIVQDSIDEYIVKVLHKKKSVADTVLGDNTDDVVKKVSLSRKDVRNILGSVQT